MAQIKSIILTAQEHLALENGWHRGCAGTNNVLNDNTQVFKLYRDYFGTLPMAVSGNSPQPKPTDPPGGNSPW